MKTREVTAKEKEELFDYLVNIEYRDKVTRESIESIFEDVPLVVFEDYEVKVKGYCGNVLLVYMVPLYKHEGKTTMPQVYYWPHGKIVKAGGIPIDRLKNNPL